MKNAVRISRVILLILSIFLFHSCKPPIISTTAVTAISYTAAISGGEVTNRGGTPVTARGVCWNTSLDPTTANNKTIDGTGTGRFTSLITGLNANTTYYVRAYATNFAGTAYGTHVSFTTSSGGQTSTVTDIDGNIYNTVTIGKQVWMKVNLKTTKYNDGTAIPLVTEGEAWAALSTPGYCWLNNDADTYKSAYGALYNWYAVNTGKLCPTGWHVSSDAEWTALTTYLGGETVAGGKLKDTGTGYWWSPNTGATNETGFTAISGGSRFDGGAFSNIWSAGIWWCSTEHSISNAWYRVMYYNYSNVVGNYGFNKKVGLSVRCLKDI